MLTAAPFCHIVIPAPDLGKAKAFYEAVFGWEVKAEVPAPTYWFFSSGNVGGAFSSEMKPSRGATIPLFLRVEDLEAALGRVLKHGGKVTKAKGPIGDADPGFDAHVLDPNGNALGLYSAS